MKKKMTRPNYKVVNNSTSPLYVSLSSSPIIKYQAVTLSVGGTTLWTPAAGNSIYLTAISCSSLLNITANVNFSRTGGGIFLTVDSAPYVQSFPSPVMFNPNESIVIASPSLTLLVNVSLFGYEL